MAATSTLHNSPHPNTVLPRYDLMEIDTDKDRERDLKSRRFYFHQALHGTKEERAEARLMLRTHPRWRIQGWYTKGAGDVMGSLSAVVKDLEARRC